MEVLSEIERTRRAELNSDTKSAVALGISLDEFRALRDEAIDSWCKWLHSEMSRTGVDDPVELLPQLAVRIEQRAAAAARVAAQEAAKETIKSMLTRALR